MKDEGPPFFLQEIIYHTEKNITYIKRGKGEVVHVFILHKSREGIGCLSHQIRYNCVGTNSFCTKVTMVLPSSSFTSSSDRAIVSKRDHSRIDVECLDLFFILGLS